MEFKGTKGEWYATKEGNIFSKTVEERIKQFPDIKAKLDGEIAQCWADFENNKIIPDEECNANAKLMAAAPDLLNALTEIMRFKNELRYVMGERLATPENFLKAIDEAEKAIKKALDYEGEDEIN